MFELDDNLIDVIESLYFAHLVNIVLDHGLSHADAREIAREFFQTMRDY